MPTIGFHSHISHVFFRSLGVQGDIIYIYYIYNYIYYIYIYILYIYRVLNGDSIDVKHG